MAKGNRIIVSAQPKGVFEEIFGSGTPKPGTVMELKTGVALKGGRWTYEPAGTTAASGSRGMAADGDRIGINVLLCFIDHASCPPGKLATDAYATGEHGAIYWPCNGEELNMLFFNQAGTADDVGINDKMIVDDGTGQVFVSTGSVESEPFLSLEALVDPTADALLWMKYIAQ